MVLKHCSALALHDELLGTLKHNMCPFIKPFMLLYVKINQCLSLFKQIKLSLIFLSEAVVHLGAALRSAPVSILGSAKRMKG